MAANNNYTIMVMERPANDDEIREYTLSVVLVCPLAVTVCMFRRIFCCVQARLPKAKSERGRRCMLTGSLGQGERFSRAESLRREKGVRVLVFTWGQQLQHSRSPRAPETLHHFCCLHRVRLVVPF